MKIEFLMAGSPNDAFYSQAGMFRLALDSLGGSYRDGRLVLCLVSGDGPLAVPRRWLPWFERIEVRWADSSHAGRLTHGQELFGMVDVDADLSIICDADTIFVRPLPEDFLHEFASAPALCGVVAHYPPPTHSFDDFPPPSSAEEMWKKMGAALGRSINLTVPYTLPSGTDLAPSFYVNHAFLGGPPHLIRHLGVLQAKVRPALESVLTNQFDDQIAVALAVETEMLPHRRLPLRFNFPNDVTADRLYPEEMRNIIFLHYLRQEVFDRHKIFTTKENFDGFMALQLEGSNAVFQDAVRRLTKGDYPFTTPSPSSNAQEPRPLNMDLDNLQFKVQKILQTVREMGHEYWWLRSPVAELFESNGYHLVPQHFYGPLPSVDEIAQTRFDVPKYPLEPLGWRPEDSAEALRALTPYWPEFKAFAADAKRPAQLNFTNSSYNDLDSFILYAMVRLLRPNKIIDIGSCFWSPISYEAIRRNGIGSMTCITPSPSPELLELSDRIEILRCRVQDADLNMFEALSVNDICFIDSSHVNKLESDANFGVLRLLPILRDRVVVHFHQVYLPFEYPAWCVRERRWFWSEQYLLYAYLIGSSNTIEVIFPTFSAMVNCHDRLHELVGQVPEVELFGSSFWFRIKHGCDRLRHEPLSPSL